MDSNRLAGPDVCGEPSNELPKVSGVVRRAQVTHGRRHIFDAHSDTAFGFHQQPKRDLLLGGEQRNQKINTFRP